VIVWKHLRALGVGYCLCTSYIAVISRTMRELGQTLMDAGTFAVECCPKEVSITSVVKPTATMRVVLLFDT